MSLRFIFFLPLFAGSHSPNYFFSFFFLLLSSSTFPFLPFSPLSIHKTSKMVKSAVLGYPRIGVNRAMKKVSDASIAKLPPVL